MVIYGLGRVVIEGLRTDSQMFLSTDIRVNQVFSAIFIIVGGALYLFNRNSKDYVLVKDEKDRPAKKSKPGRIQVKKIENQPKTNEEGVVSEYKAMTDEMRTLRAKALNDKE